MPEYKVENLYSGTKVDTGSLYAHSYLFCDSPRLCNHCKAHIYFLKIASDREKWSSYVVTCISGSYGVNAATPLWAGTEALIPGGQCGQPLRNETERSHYTFKFYLIGSLLVFRYPYLKRF